MVESAMALLARVASLVLVRRVGYPSTTWKLLRTAWDQHDWQTISEGSEPGTPVVAQRCWGKFQELARKHAPEALDVLIQIMLNEKAPPNARVAAANTLLDRAYGKAPMFCTSDTQVFKRAIDMTDDELAAIVGRAKLTLVKSDYVVPYFSVSICRLVEA